MMEDDDVCMEEVGILGGFYGGPLAGTQLLGFKTDFLVSEEGFEKEEEEIGMEGEGGLFGDEKDVVEWEEKDFGLDDTDGWIGPKDWTKSGKTNDTDGWTGGETGFTPKSDWNINNAGLAPKSDWNINNAGLAPKSDWNINNADGWTGEENMKTKSVSHFDSDITEDIGEGVNSWDGALKVNNVGNWMDAGCPVSGSGAGISAPTPIPTISPVPPKCVCSIEDAEPVDIPCVKKDAESDTSKCHCNGNPQIYVLPIKMVSECTQCS